MRKVQSCEAPRLGPVWRSPCPTLHRSGAGSPVCWVLFCLPSAPASFCPWAFAHSVLFSRDASSWVFCSPASPFPTVLQALACTPGPTKGRPCPPGCRTCVLSCDLTVPRLLSLHNHRHSLSFQMKTSDVSDYFLKMFWPAWRPPPLSGEKGA